MKLRISNELRLPLDVVTQKLAFLGRTGSGKSYAATKLAELMLGAGGQVIALDPVGIWHGLRLGEHPIAIPVFGGLHGDIPLEAGGGALIADLIVDRGISIVLDVSQMIAAEQTRFATDFATRFFQRKKASPSAVHLFLEECQEVVPQNPQKGEEKMLHAFQRLQKLGRNFGIGVSLISQRPQEVSKKALNQAECVFAFQMTGPQERKTMAGWVAEKGLDTDVQALLPKLPVGTCHVWSPQWLDISRTVAIEPKETADVSATPKVGARTSKPRELSPVDLEALGKAMAATIERAKADDPRELRKRIAELEKQLKAAPVATPARENRVEVPVLGKKTEASIRGLLKGFDRFAKQSDAINTLQESVDKLTRELNAALKPTAPTLPPPLVKAVVTHVVRDIPPRVVSGAGSSEVGTGGLRRIMIALAQRPQGLNPRQLGVRAQLSSRSGTFATYLARGRTSGWITGSSLLQITETGIAALGSYEPLPTGQALLAYWLQELGSSGAARILQALAEAYPKTLSNTEAGEAAGLSAASGTFATYLSKLRTLELIEGGRGELRASAELFE